MKVKTTSFESLLGRMFAILPLAGLLSCGLVMEDLAECPSPVTELRFVYEYNMERANAFHNQVDCLSAMFFDSDGTLVAVEKEIDRSLLADENYRMRPELPDGTYHVVVYGGMECENASFSHARNMIVGSSKLSDLRVQLYPSCLTDSDRHRLHNHYYGAADFTVVSGKDTYVTVEMMRNTNSVQVALQNENGGVIDHNDFIFEIIDDNNDFNHENNLLTTGEITYKPWITENRSTGTVSKAGGDDDEWYAALARFTTSRLVIANPQTKPTAATLRIRRSDSGETVFRIPLVNYMLMFKHDNSDAGLEDMGDQEYLDRENTWNFVFFLKDGLWVDGHIIINDWEVRMNNTDF